MKKHGIQKHFREIFQRYELIIELTKRQLTISHKGSALGFVWILLNPLLLLALYILVFGFIFNGKIQSDGAESRFEYGLTIFMGLMVIHFLTEVLTGAPRVLYAHSNFVQRTTIPTQVIPISTFLTAAIHFFASSVLFLIGFICLQKALSLHALWALPILFFLFLLGLGLSWLLASLGTLFKDTAEIMPSFGMAILFGSAVFYPVNQIPANIWYFLKLNPVLHIVNELRSTFLWQNDINNFALLYIGITSTSFFLIGWFVFYFTKEKLVELV